MIEFLQFILTIGVIYQTTSIISESSFPLFSFLRNLHEWPTNNLFWMWLLKGISDFFSCFLCVSVWIGCIGSAVLFDISKFIGYESVSWLISGLFYSFIVWFIHLIEGKMS